MIERTHFFFLYEPARVQHPEPAYQQANPQSTRDRQCGRRWVSRAVLALLVKLQGKGAIHGGSHGIRK
jgi:hypothetical protein